MNILKKRSENDFVYSTKTTIEDAISMIQADIKRIFKENGIKSNIIGIEIIGSRRWGYHKDTSDIDVLVEFDGDYREDTIFNILHEHPIYIEGILVDINPINANETISLEEHIKKDDEYSKEKLLEYIRSSQKTDTQ